MEKLNLLINNIPYHSFKGEVIYDNTIESINRGMITYITDGNDDDIFNYCDINEYKTNINKKYIFVFSSHMLRWDTFKNLLISDDLFGQLLREILSSKNVTCAFIDIHESDNLYDLKKLNRVFNRFNFNKNKIWILNNDSNLSKFVEENSLGLNVGKTNYLNSFTHEIFYENYDSIQKSISDKFFLCINKRQRIHRVSSLAYLKNIDLLKQTNYSVLESNNNEDDDFERFLGIDEFLRLESDLKYILDNSPKQTDFESIHNTDLLNVNKYTYAGIIDFDDYKTTTVNIVNESMYETNSVHITEKSFKPIGFCQLPVFVASPHHVKYLREYYGLDMYDDIINHSYDDEENHRKRLKMVIDEVKRLYDNKESVINFWNLNKDRILKNRKILKDILDKKLDYNFFKNKILCI